MRREDFKYYFKNKIKIKVFLRTEYKYSGEIVELGKESFKIKDSTAGVVTISYEDVVSPIKEDRGRQGKR